MTELKELNRRDFIKTGLQAGLGALLATAVPALGAKKAYAALGTGAWKVNLNHAHTGERFSGIYRVGDHYDPEALKKINYFLRDFRSGEIYPMDPHVLDIVSLLQARTGSGRPFNIISGYRCPRTNMMLRAEGGSRSGVAKNSLHMHGQAIDLNMEGVRTAHLRDLAKGLRAGGVGYYPSSDFVHVDTGKVRYW